MRIENARVLFVGAAGGIGRYLAKELLDAGARPCLVALREEELGSLREFLGASGNEACYLAADVTQEADRQACLRAMREKQGGIDVLINLAGINAFARYEEQSPEAIERIMSVNAVAPMLMTHTVLPEMLRQGAGRIVNVGSTFGSIGFSCFTAYSTSKFALRGFSQALRRELAGSGVEVTYIAPRGVETPLNPPEVYAMAREVKMAFDQPETVAREILDTIRKGSKEKYIGFPESLFARINGIFPGVVDNAVKKQNEVMRKYAANGDDV
ncbi:SDR family oxidoreductase [Thiolapillus sp.]